MSQARNSSQAMSAIAATAAQALHLRPGDKLFDDLVFRAADRALDVLQSQYPGVPREQLKHIALMELNQ